MISEISNSKTNLVSVDSDDPKKATHTAEMMSVLCVAIFWVVNASSGEKSYLQFSIPTGSGAGGEGGVSYRLKEKFLKNFLLCCFCYYYFFYIKYKKYYIFYTKLKQLYFFENLFSRFFTLIIRTRGKNVQIRKIQEDRFKTDAK